MAVGVLVWVDSGVSVPTNGTTVGVVMVGSGVAVFMISNVDVAET